MTARIVAACALLGALAGGIVALARGSEYEARSFVIRVPPDFAGERGVERARTDATLRRVLAVAGESGGDVEWLRDHSSAEVTSRLDLSFTVRAPERQRSVSLATAYAKAFRAQIPPAPGQTTHGRGARDAERPLGPIGWMLLGGAAGAWLGAALAIVLAGRIASETAAAAR